MCFKKTLSLELHLEVIDFFAPVHSQCASSRGSNFRPPRLPVLPLGARGISLISSHTYRRPAGQLIVMIMRQMGLDFSLVRLSLPASKSFAHPILSFRFISLGFDSSGSKLEVELERSYRVQGRSAMGNNLARARPFAPAELAGSHQRLARESPKVFAPPLARVN